MTEKKDGNKLIEFWTREFERVHGFPPLFEKKDAVMLQNLRKHFNDPFALAWAIKKFMSDEDPFIAKAGWSVPAFKNRVQGMMSDFYKRYGHKTRDSGHAKRAGNVIDIMAAKMDRGKRDG